ncbi:MAG: deoxyribodipyrimidine photo-lyase, partial [Bacteroidota bacterium]
MNNLIWFGNDLRVNDNQSLAKASHGDSLLAVYFFDPRFFEKYTFGFKKTERFRAQFLIETLVQLKTSLEAINISLLVFHDRPENILPDLVSQYQIHQIFKQREWTSEEVEILQGVTSSLPKEIQIIESFDQFLFHP